MKIIYRIYQTLICAPVIILSLMVLTGATVIGTKIGDAKFWAYHPGRIWSKIVVRILLLSVHVEGRENLDKNSSYVFVANHQGAFDIFLIYGYLNKNFKWMMKYQLLKIPFVGATCRASEHIIVDKRSPAKILDTLNKARKTLQNGMSLVEFPEGSRSKDGTIGKFHRGGFVLADELQLPVVPLTINGSFDVLPRTRKSIYVTRRHLTLTIHKPIMPVSQGDDNVQYLMQESRNAITSAFIPPIN